MRVLHVITGMGSGGAESFIINMYRRMDRRRVQFDFLLRSDENIYVDEIKSMGGRIFTTARYPRHFIRNWRETRLLFRSHPEIDVVHVHGNALLYVTALFLAKKHGIPCRIMHSHNTNVRRPPYRAIHELNKLYVEKLATDRFACSDEAGKWMFRGPYRVIRNAIDIDKYSFDSAVRADARRELDLSGKFVVGHVGRFLASKNHPFLLEVFQEVLKQEPRAILLLVGSGPLEPAVRLKVEELGIKDSVRFLGVRKDVERLMQAMDVFVLPSLFEGLPVVLIEAQAAGLHCFVSSVIPSMAQAGSLHSIKLEAGSVYWADEILRNRLGVHDRLDAKARLAAAGFDVRSEARELEEFYLAQLERLRR